MKCLKKLAIVFVLTLVLACAYAAAEEQQLPQMEFSNQGSGESGIDQGDDTPGMRSSSSIPPEGIQSEVVGGLPVTIVENEPDDEPPAKPPVERSVRAECVVKPLFSDDDEFNLKATLFGFDGTQVRVQWQFNRGDEYQWQDAGDIDKGAQALSYRVKASEENLHIAWRIVVTTADFEGRVYEAMVNMPTIYRVVFEDASNNTLREMRVPRGQNVSRYVPQPPQMEGLVFVGWTADNGSTLKRIMGDTVFTASYQPQQEGQPVVPEEPGVEPEEPDVDPEEPGIEPVEPDVDPEEPGSDPEDPGIDPEEPGIEPEEPGIEPEEPDADPKEPGVEPEEPGSDPEEPDADPDAPGHDPVEPDTDPEEPGIEPEEPDADPEAPDEPTVEQSIVIERVIDDILYVGDTFRMEATLIGFNEWDVKLQWQFNAGNGWVDIIGADGLVLTVVANHDTVNYSWRLVAMPLAAA